MSVTTAPKVFKLAGGTVLDSATILRVVTLTLAPGESPVGSGTFYFVLDNAGGIFIGQSLADMSVLSLNNYTDLQTNCVLSNIDVFVAKVGDPLVSIPVIMVTGCRYGELEGTSDGGPFLAMYTLSSPPAGGSVEPRFSSAIFPEYAANVYGDTLVRSFNCVGYDGLDPNQLLALGWSGGFMNQQFNQACESAVPPTLTSKHDGASRAVWRIESPEVHPYRHASYPTPRISTMGIGDKDFSYDGIHPLLAVAARALPMASTQVARTHYPESPMEWWDEPNSLRIMGARVGSGGEYGSPYYLRLRDMATNYADADFENLFNIEQGSRRIGIPLAIANAIKNLTPDEYVTDIAVGLAVESPIIPIEDQSNDMYGELHLLLATNQRILISYADGTAFTQLGLPNDKGSTYGLVCGYTGTFRDPRLLLGYGTRRLGNEGTALLMADCIYYSVNASELVSYDPVCVFSDRVPGWRAYERGALIYLHPDTNVSTLPNGFWAVVVMLVGTDLASGSYVADFLYSPTGESWGLYARHNITAMAVAYMDALNPPGTTDYRPGTIGEPYIIATNGMIEVGFTALSVVDGGDSRMIEGRIYSDPNAEGFLTEVTHSGSNYSLFNRIWSKYMNVAGQNYPSASLVDTNQRITSLNYAEHSAFTMNEVVAATFSKNLDECMDFNLPDFTTVNPARMAIEFLVPFYVADDDTFIDVGMARNGTGMQAFITNTAAANRYMRVTEDAGCTAADMTTLKYLDDAVHSVAFYVTNPRIGMMVFIRTAGVVAHVGFSHTQLSSVYNQHGLHRNSTEKFLFYPLAFNAESVFSRKVGEVETVYVTDSWGNIRTHYAPDSGGVFSENNFPILSTYFYGKANLQLSHSGDYWVVTYCDMPGGATVVAISSDLVSWDTVARDMYADPYLGTGDKVLGIIPSGDSSYTVGEIPNANDSVSEPNSIFVATYP